MELKVIIEIAIGTFTLIAFIYKIIQVESRIYKEIDSTGDITSSRLNALENSLNIHITDCAARNDHRDYMIHGLNEKIDHKFNRCWDEIKHLEKDLNKEG
ncbi:MAG: hypothetical protein AAF378_08295 [Cyanobacteria bacterium P01_A01_bin.84]